MSPQAGQAQRLPFKPFPFLRRGAQADGFPAFHTVLVSDSRRRSGENAAMARVIASLPFTDTGDSSGFADNYRCQATVGQLNMVPANITGL
jgi:hypothetical protein